MLHFIAAVLVAQSAPGPDSLTSVATHIGKALAKGDWKTFRKYAADHFTIEEHWRSYDQDLKTPKRWEKGMLGSAGRTISFSTVVPNTSAIAKENLKPFNAFCKLMRESQQDWSSGWGSWPPVETGSGPHVLDSMTLTGPCVLAKIVSNIDVAVSMERIGGKWKAKRLIVSGH